MFIFNNVDKDCHMDRSSLFWKFLLIGALFASCEYNVENEEAFVDDLCLTTVSYSATIRPLIDNNCMPCHNGDGKTPFAPNLTTYQAVESVSLLVKALTQSRVMPKEGSLTNAEIAAIKCWVDNGSLDN